MISFRFKNGGLCKAASALLICAFLIPFYDAQSGKISVSCLDLELNQAPSPSPEFTRLDHLVSKLSPDGIKSGKKVSIVMGAVELGEVPGLTTEDGKPLHIAAGGVSAVLNDMARYFPGFLKNKAHAEISAVGILMDGVSKKNLTFVRTLQVKLDGQIWDIGVYRYLAPDGIEYTLLENPSFKRLTVKPAQGESVYTLRGLEEPTRENELEKQRIYSAFNQAIAQVFVQKQADVYLPHDYHAAPAAFYIRQGENAATHPVLSTKVLVHNERYVGHFKVDADQRELIRKIWNLSESELNEYFMHGDHLLMLAPAVRVAEQNEIFTAMSVSEGSAEAINQKDEQWPDYFGRAIGNTNGFGEENRPPRSALLAPASEGKLKADGITNPEVIAEFSARGFQYGFKDQSPESILAAKKRAKAAFQKNLGLTVDPDRPLFVSFARMVHQKGLIFVAENIRHILDQGGQIVVGGPTGDTFGDAERAAFLAIKQQLEAEHNPKARDFVFIDGPVKGHLKGLMLAGGDFFLIPSRYEPCGLTDCEALSHGTLPIAHKTGGLTKGKNTILYTSYDENDQGLALGEAIKEGIQKFRDRPAFEARQLAAAREEFSVETNFDKFAQIYRVESYGKMILELARLEQSRSISETQAEQILADRLTHAAPGDLQALLQGLGMMHPDRRSPLMEWVIKKFPDESRLSD